MLLRTVTAIKLVLKFSKRTGLNSPLLNFNLHLAYSSCTTWLFGTARSNALERITISEGSLTVLWKNGDDDVAADGLVVPPREEKRSGVNASAISVCSVANDTADRIMVSDFIFSCNVKGLGKQDEEFCQGW